jgi:hypothetical protein
MVHHLLPKTVTRICCSEIHILTPQKLQILKVVKMIGSRLIIKFSKAPSKQKHQEVHPWSKDLKTGGMFSQKLFKTRSRMAVLHRMIVPYQMEVLTEIEPRISQLTSPARRTMTKTPSRLPPHD